jgi:hypothetical protein
MLGKESARPSNKMTRVNFIKSNFWDGKVHLTHNSLASLTPLNLYCFESSPSSSPSLPLFLFHSHLPYFCKFSLTLNCSSPSSYLFSKISLSLTPPLPLPHCSSPSPVLLFYFKFSKFLFVARTLSFSNLILSSPCLSHVLSLILEGSRFFWTHGNRSKFLLKLEFLNRNIRKKFYLWWNLSISGFLTTIPAPRSLYPCSPLPAPGSRASHILHTCTNF